MILDELVEKLDAWVGNVDLVVGLELALVLSYLSFIELSNSPTLYLAKTSKSSSLCL